jgi:hypothetical protein
VHSVKLPPHVTSQLPALHTFPAAQALPHVPQLALSVCVLAQYGAPPSGVHSVKLPPHVTLQLPALHTFPAAQALPHVPQLALSVCVLAQ